MEPGAKQVDAGPGGRPGVVQRYGVALLAVGIATILRTLLGPISDDILHFTAFYAAVIAAAYRGGLGPGLFATGLSAAMGTRLFVWPHGHAIHPQDESSLLIFVISGVVISIVGGRLITSREQSRQDAALLRAELTERHRVEADLRKSSQRLQAIFDHAGVGIVEADADNHFIAVNDRACHILGYSREQLLGMTVHELTAPDDQGISDDLNAQLRDGRLERLDYEKRYMRRDGTPVWVHVTVSAVRDLDGRYRQGIATMEDIGVQKAARDALTDWSTQLEREVAERTAKLQETVEELRRSNEDLEKFAYISSHDLQEPLRNVSLYVGWLARDYQGKLGPEADEYIALAKDGAVRMSNLIKDLLAYSRVNSEGQFPVPTDSGKVLTDVLETLRPSVAEVGGEVTHDELPMVVADAAQLGQVFQNLIGNSLKYRKDGEPPRIHVSAAACDGQWLFRVRDNGIGIDPQYHDQIFVAFKRLQTDRLRYPGSGIGLAIVKRIIERHHGQIGVESKLGEGATFHFTLPGSQDD